MKFKLGSIILILILILNMNGCIQNNISSEKSDKDNLTVSDSETISQENDTEDIPTVEEGRLNTEANDNSKLMKDIKEEAINGVNIYCDNIKLGDNISDVIEIYGEDTEHNYISEAKGVYYNYNENDFAFGCNKGEQIFEIRSYNNELKNLSLNDIENYFGVPDYKNKTSLGEQILGYKVSDTYKILFVFGEGYLDHYSVFYPEITANYMADDPGRKW